LYNLGKGAKSTEHRASAKCICSINAQPKLDGSYRIIYDRCFSAEQSKEGRKGTKDVDLVLFI